MRKTTRAAASPPTTKPPIVFEATDYTTRVLHGRHFVNGEECEDFLDCLGGQYTVATPAPVTPEIARLVSLAFTAGIVAGRQEVRHAE